MIIMSLLCLYRIISLNRSNAEYVYGIQLDWDAEYHNNGRN